MFRIKVYIVQRATRDGILTGEVIAAKLTFTEAQSLAKAHAPAKVTMLFADKTPFANGVGQNGHHDVCKPSPDAPRPVCFADLDAKYPSSRLRQKENTDGSNGHDDFGRDSIRLR